MTDTSPQDTGRQHIYQEFEKLVAGEDSAIDLAQAALLIASIEYPDLDRGYYLAQLDTFAGRVRTALGLPEATTQKELPEGVEPLTVIDALNQVLFEEEHFHGNEQDYYNPNNSFLNKVLEEHTGIPITLSLLYMEVGRRVGIQIDGVGLPYHFIVRCPLPQESVYIDPYARGLLMNEQGCRDRIRQLAQHRVKIHAHWFAPVSHRHMLVRMLNNLKKIYITADDYSHILSICDLLVVLLPDVGSEWRDRGLIHLQLKQYGHAIKDLTRYLRLTPEAEDKAEIVEYIKTARQALALLN